MTASVTLTDFHPISVASVLFRVMERVLVHRYVYPISRSVCLTSDRIHISSSYSFASSGHKGFPEQQLLWRPSCRNLIIRTKSTTGWLTSACNEISGQSVFRPFYKRQCGTRFWCTHYNIHSHRLRPLTYAPGKYYCIVVDDMYLIVGSEMRAMVNFSQWNNGRFIITIILSMSVYQGGP